MPRGRKKEDQGKPNPKRATYREKRSVLAKRKKTFFDWRFLANGRRERTRRRKKAARDRSIPDRAPLRCDHDHDALTQMNRACPAADNGQTARQVAARKEATYVARATGRRKCRAATTDALPVLLATLQKRRWHHALCMRAMHVPGAVALWKSGADSVSGEAPVRVALDAGHAIVALAMLEATTPFALVGTAGDTGRHAAANADRICRRLSSHMALALRPREVWRMIVTWEAGGRRFRRREHGKPSTPATMGDTVGTAVPDAVHASGHSARDSRETRRAWRFLLRFRLVAFLGALAKASTEAELVRFWETSAPQTRVHILEVVLTHAERTLRLAERPHCQRVWAEAAAGTTIAASGQTGGRHRRPDKPGASAGLLPAMRGAVASLRNVALWAARAQSGTHTT